MATLKEIIRAGKTAAALEAIMADFTEEDKSLVTAVSERYTPGRRKRRGGGRRKATTAAKAAKVAKKPSKRSKKDEPAAPAFPSSRRRVVAADEDEG